MTENTTIESTKTKVKFSATPEGKLFNFFWKPAWFILRPVTACIFALVVCFAVRAAFPMNIPQARGMTYYQFLSHRWTSLRDGTENPHMEYVVGMYSIVPVFYLGLGLPLSFCEMYPDTKMASQLKSGFLRSVYGEFKPPYKIIWSNLPKSLWDMWEKVNWALLVSDYPFDPPMTFPDTTN